MTRACQKCDHYYDDEFRTTICPHDTFAANDGKNNFAHHPESTLKPIPKELTLDYKQRASGERE